MTVSHRRMFKINTSGSEQRCLFLLLFPLFAILYIPFFWGKLSDVVQSLKRDKLSLEICLLKNKGIDLVVHIEDVGRVSVGAKHTVTNRKHIDDETYVDQNH